MSGGKKKAKRGRQGRRWSAGGHEAGKYKRTAINGNSAVTHHGMDCAGRRVSGGYFTAMK